MQSIIHFQNSDKIHGSWARTHLIFISKTSNPNCIKDFRPLAMCNAIYKILSKALANRIKPHLPYLIKEEQAAFIQERLIQDNIYIVQEIAHSMHKNKAKNPIFLIKIDLEKAFDTIKREAISLAMRVTNSPPKFINWIEACNYLPTFSCCINDDHTPYFTANRGIRQGDPLSPYLYMITSNILSIIIDNRVKGGKITPFNIKGKCKISHIINDDDIILCFRANKKSC